MKLKKIISPALIIGLSLTLFSNLVLAAPVAEKPAADENVRLEFKRAPESPAHGLTPLPPSFDGPRFGMGGPLMLIDGEALWGLSFLGLGEVTRNLLLGGETGFFVWSKSEGTTSATEWVIPLLVTAQYRFATENHNFIPYLGASIGPSFIHLEVEQGARQRSGSATAFTFFARAGAHFGDDQKYFSEIKLGSIDGNFVFLPTFGIFF